MEKAKILVVEDEAVIAHELKGRLREMGYEVLDMAATGEDAISIFHKTPPDLVLMDIVLLGEMDGIETARQLRSIKGVPIIYLTAYTDAMLLDRAKETEAFGYLSKPFSDHDLRNTIEMALYKHKAEKEIVKFKFISDHANDAHFLSGGDAKFNYVNENACRMMGYSKEELLSLGVPDVDVLYDLSKYRELFDLVQRETVPPIETINKRKDGTTFQSEITVTGYQIEGRPYMFAALRDITERKLSEEKLRENEEFIRVVMDHLPIGVAVNSVDPVVDFNYMNDNFPKVYRTTRKALADPDAFWHVVYEDPEFREDIKKKVLDDCASGDPDRMHWEDVPITRKGEATVFICARNIPVPGKHLMISTVWDITRRKKAEIELKKAFEEINRLKEKFEAENVFLREEIKLQHKHGEIIGQGDAIKGTLKLVEQVAGTDSTVLILGETGTGKELLAQAIHNISKRKDRPMVKVNCAAIPSNLIESELFGREKGAYTGAITTQVGRFEVANGSTLFLDEIGELSSELQAKLLRVLQDGSLERLGSTKTIKVDVRVVAATNRDIEQAVEDGEFRSDLYYRLNVFPISVPPLRERHEDILPLVWSFVREFEKAMGRQIKSIPKKDIQILKGYSWPGNVREMKNLIERSMILTRGPILKIEMPQISESGLSKDKTLDQFEKEYIISVLKKTDWRVRGERGAAEILGLKPTTLDARMKKLDIKR